MNANELLKHNIDALLKARGFMRRDLARHVKRTTNKRAESWLSKIFTSQAREIPMKYLDRIADFFGLATYQLFQPGLSAQTERRSGSDRRAGTDRRVSALNHHVREQVSSVIANLSAADVADIIRWRALPQDSRAAARAALQELEDAERRNAASKTGRRGAGKAGATATATGTRGRHHRDEEPTER